ncbi:peptidoglycan/LPS O-acetylase OafA/YrhL [Litorimonas taeanensis]|uniref:Peptidoglycan/LPS O-acetylase OafA/YrhL n=1 Tax=Litorimonas taeanensis TaxID=568099 RepID=A0A420WIN1_9PROT|nr:acyltransferase [Litorimonas taeanensis]RKQ70775.1 peptidoglycan/LPS O-acetylase OafA/YrhL [Litorimonas taeanensis]
MLNRFKSVPQLSPAAEYGYIAGLDGIRAIAVLIVIIAHFEISRLIPGGFGVTVFFFISGFLITRLLLAEAKKKGRIHLKDFYIRRVVRLFPALIFMVVGSTGLYLVLGQGGPKPLEFTAALGYFTNIYQVMIRAGGELPFMPWTHLWSLAVEEHFYLIFPLFLVAFGAFKKRLVWALLGVLALIPLWRLYTFTHFETLPVVDYNYMMTDTRLDSIVWGCLLSVLLDKDARLGLVKKLTGWLPIIVATSMLLLCFAIRDESFRFIWRYSLQGIGLFVLVLNLFFFRPVKWSLNLLEIWPLVWIGRLSYPLYLWHFPVLDLSHRLMEPGPAQLLVAIGGSFAISIFSFFVVEKPFLALRKKFGAHIVKRPANLSSADEPSDVMMSETKKPDNPNMIVTS